MLYLQPMTLVHPAVVWFPDRIDRNPDVIDAENPSQQPISGDLPKLIPYIP